MLTITNLSKSFGGVKAVNSCSFEIEKGKITALIGPNGSGKTTIFNLVSGILKADSGRVNLNGEDITILKPHEIAERGISRLFQHSRLFNNLSVEENLKIALREDDTKFWKNFFGMNKKTDSEKIKAILKTVDMGKYKEKKSEELSYGQKRLAEIARAAIKPHKLLMLDEPVAGVNPKLRKKISTAIKELKEKGDTILLIEHDMEFTLSISDKVIVLDEGKVIAEGTPEQIKNNKKVLEAYLGE